MLSAAPIPSSDVVRRRDRANAFCECIRAVDATGMFIQPGHVFLSYSCLVFPMGVQHLCINFILRTAKADE